MDLKQVKKLIDSTKLAENDVIVYSFTGHKLGHVEYFPGWKTYRIYMDVGPDIKLKTGVGRGYSFKVEPKPAAHKFTLLDAKTGMTHYCKDFSALAVLAVDILGPGVVFVGPEFTSNRYPEYHSNADAEDFKVLTLFYKNELVAVICPVHQPEPEEPEEHEYEFTVTLFGTGVDVDEAWEQARSRTTEDCDLPKFDSYKEV